MDKAEYKIATEHIKKLIAQGEYAEASYIADTIDWRRVKSVMMLCTVSDLYKVNRRYEDAKELLYMAYERNPESRTILYALCDLCIKLEEFVAAIEYYKAFVEVAPRDTGRYVLQYRLYQAQDVGLEERIEVLEQLKKEEYIEKWAYELAYLYHRIGFATKCVEECDELILWFGKGRYVYKAMELKMLHEPLTPSQQRVYEQRFQHLEQAKDMTRVLPRIDSGNTGMTDENMVDVTDAPTVEIPQEYIEKAIQGEVEDIQVKTLDVTNVNNTMNLQKELANSLKEILEVSQVESSLEKGKVEDITSSYADTSEIAQETVDITEGTTIEEVQPEVNVEESVEEAVEKQTTSQMSVEAVLAAWNAQEEQSEEAHKEKILNRIKSQTQDIFAAFEAERNRGIPEEAYVEEAIVDELQSEDVPSEEVQLNGEFSDETLSEEVQTEEVISEEKVFEESAEEEIAEEEPVCEVPSVEEPVLEVQETSETVLEVVEQQLSDAYTSFIRAEKTRKQIITAKESLSMVAHCNNISVTGHDMVTCFDFIKTFIADTKAQGMEFEGKTAKISAVNLNKKEPSEIISKVQGGILIIERAGRLRQETVRKILEGLKEDGCSMLLFITDTEQGMNRFVERYPEMAKAFELRVDIKDYTGDELIQYAVKYAYQNEYSIDEMGLLALRTCIEDMISNDEAPTMDDAKDIIDDAIDHVNRKNLRHFMDILLRKRYDDEDMIILRERDFM